ncbi:P-type conjugative transfer ATPase TrbB [Rhizobium cauense]|uniref:P-type conjugative transfer ATPase TrbB n=1 Tax=Rhizobium cauense TaxID=1166683 RepID=UPI001C6F44B8|nr:P-type conjugative transfer ATPase TrbB [Rhizobium cauense]MBW9118382.1 P-type conjugative transfer ATPase TrbB [Rhizobium cauense]
MNLDNKPLLRLVTKLQHALGDLVCSALDDPEVVEVMLNPDGKLFVEKSGRGIDLLGELTPSSAETVIGSIAHLLNSDADERRPIISGELPIGGHRFEGLLPPVVASPSFTIRRRAARVFSLDDYVVSEAMTIEQARAICTAVANKMNIVIAGGTGSGKTTLANAILAEMVEQCPQHRFVILEDTAEINCTASNAVCLRTCDSVDLCGLLKSTMRLRPDRIIVGEVRDGAALTLLKAWNTGHPGGIVTIHANTALSALHRLEQLTGEASQQPMPTVIGDVVDLIIAIERTPLGRRVTEILRVEHFADGYYQTKPFDEDE